MAESSLRGRKLKILAKAPVIFMGGGWLRRIPAMQESCQVLQAFADGQNSAKKPGKPNSPWQNAVSRWHPSS
jgi:hypothetical protein